MLEVAFLVAFVLGIASSAGVVRAECAGDVDGDGTPARTDPDDGVDSPWMRAGVQIEIVE